MILKCQLPHKIVNLLQKASVHDSAEDVFLDLESPTAWSPPEEEDDAPVLQVTSPSYYYLKEE